MRLKYGRPGGAPVPGVRSTTPSTTAAGDRIVPVALGCARLGSVANHLGYRGSIRLVHQALDRGVSWFDTADAYGSGASEQILGAALAGVDDVAVSTKGGYVFNERSPWGVRGRLLAGRIVSRLPHRADAVVPVGSPRPASYAEQDFAIAALDRALEASLRRLRRERVELYQLHGPPATMSPSARDDLVGWASSMVERGKIGSFGIGAESLAQAAPWIGTDGLGAVQLPFGVLDPQAGDDLLSHADAAGLQVLARGVLGAGLLGDGTIPATEPKAATIQRVRELARQSGVSVVELAIAFVRRRPEVDVIVAGARSAEHLDGLTAAATRPLPPAEVIAELASLAEAGR